MQSIVSTLWSSHLQTCSFMKRPFTAHEHTTLNEKFEIQQGAAIQSGEIPGLNCLTIGNGGHRHEAGKSGFPLIVPIDHESWHAALYNHIPFVLRAVNDDLTPTQRAGYCLRKEITVDGSNYYAYYGKRLSLGDVVPTLKQTVVEDGNSVSSEYIPTSASLNPTAPAISNTQVVTTSGEYLSASGVISIPFTANDVAEIINVAKILYNDENYAVVSEFGFCTGIDRTVSVPTSSGQSNFKEVIACQVAFFVGAHYQMIFNSEGFDFRVEAGAVEPLLGSQSVTVSTL